MKLWCVHKIDIQLIEWVFFYHEICLFKHYLTTIKLIFLILLRISVAWNFVFSEKNLVYRFIIDISKSSLVLSTIKQFYKHMSLTLRNISDICSFRSFSSEGLHILKWNLVCRFIIRIFKLTYDLGTIAHTMYMYVLLDLEIYQLIFAFRSLSLQRLLDKLNWYIVKYVFVKDVM